jgi:tagatose-6-phosphate ketose/aldose isomerase
MNFNYENYRETNGGLTAREINQQPEMWRKTLQIIEDLQPTIRTFMTNALAHKNLQVYFVGAGSSAFCAQMVAPGVNQFLGYNTFPVETTDIVAAPDSLLKEDIPTMIVSFARSGNSPESIGAIEYARKRVKTLYEVAVTCADDGKLALLTGNTESRLTINLPKETNDEAFAMTSSLTSMALAAYGVFAFESFDKYKEEVIDLASIIEKKMEEIAAIGKEVAEGFDFDRVAFLGCGAHKGAAHEATVKMCELTNGNVNVVYDSSLGFRHGPKFMIKDNTYTVHFIADDGLTRKYDLDFLKETVAYKNKNKIVVLSSAPTGIEGLDYEVILGEKLENDFYLSVANVIFAQTFAFFTSQKLGLNTDSPSADGAVNRVVQGVTLYELV